MKRSIFLVAVSLQLWFFVQMATAQSVTISGNVTDAESDAPLPGVNVFIEGTTIGSSTNADGNFTIATANTSGEILVFSFVG